MQIVIIDDSQADRHLLKMVVNKVNPLLQIIEFEEGESAQKYFKQLEAQTAEEPRIIFLDLNLPRINGLELLKIFKANRKLGTIPVIVLSSTIDKGQIDECYREHANAFVVKPMSFDDYLDAVTNVCSIFLRQKF